MNFFEKLQNFMERVFNPIAEKIAENKSITAIQNGMMITMPLTIGISVITILVNLPIAPWQAFLASVGMNVTGQMMMMGVLNLMALYIVVAVSYQYAKNEGADPITPMLLTLASFICLMPQMTMVGEERFMGLAQSYLGSDGIFVALITGIVIPKLYFWLKGKNIRLKTPPSVPAMVSDSLSPIFIAMILFALVFGVNYGFSLTPYGNLFGFIGGVIGAPVMAFGANPWALLTVYTLANLFWFFGIHPAALTSVYRPVMTAASIACMEAFAAGEPLPYASMMILSMIVISGGTGNTLGLCIQACFAKSEQYRSIARTAVIPNLFNINEPVMFGFPIMFNPIFFIPLVLSSLLPGSIVILLLDLIGPFPYNPTIQLPWVTPTVITGFVQGGFILAGLILMTLMIDWLLYLPFFKVADARAYAQEQEQKAGE